jgi:NADPH:quinone reductase-like Zn-dependent oxidoreductase
MPLRIVKACTALFGLLGIPSELLQSLATEDKLMVLVNGEATSTGIAAIQLLNCCGIVKEVDA